MKKHILLLGLFLISFMVQSQTKDDYNKMVDIIVTSYNSKDTTLISNHYDQKLKKSTIALKQKAFIPEDAPEILDFDHTTNGKIVATELIMNDTDNNVYYVQFEEQDAKILTIALSESKEITALLLEDY